MIDIKSKKKKFFLYVGQNYSIYEGGEGKRHYNISPRSRTRMRMGGKGIL